jgi:hypothetical protein
VFAKHPFVFAQSRVACRCPRRAGVAVVWSTAIMLAAASAQAGIINHQLDDGVSNVTFGPPGSFAQFGDIDMLWGNYFFAAAPGEAITDVSFGLGELSAGDQVSIWIFDDPDDDADPTNAVPVYNTTVTAFDLGFDFNDFSIPSVPVEDGFFVAVGHLAVLGTDGSGNPDYPHRRASIPTRWPIALGFSTMMIFPKRTSRIRASCSEWTDRSCPFRAGSQSGPRGRSSPNRAPRCCWGDC